jgi:hypothetical protein
MSDRWLNQNNKVKPTIDQFIDDEGCSMVGRVSKDGQCGIHNNPCPPKCLLKMIGSLEAQVRMDGMMRESDRAERDKLMESIANITEASAKTINDLIAERDQVRNELSLVSEMANTMHRQRDEARKELTDMTPSPEETS